MTGGNPHIARCPVPGCTIKVGRSNLFCTIHWHRLPGRLRKALYGRAYPRPSEKDERLIARAVAALASPGDRPVAIPRPNHDAPAAPPADVSAPEGRSSRSALAAIKPETAHV